MLDLAIPLVGKPLGTVQNSRSIVPSRAPVKPPAVGPPPHDVAAGPHKATDQPQILQLTGPRLEAEIGIVP